MPKPPTYSSAASVDAKTGANASAKGSASRRRQPSSILEEQVDGLWAVLREREDAERVRARSEAVREAHEAQEAQKAEAQERAALDREQHLRRQLAARDDEVRQLRQQVRGLKDRVSEATRSDGHAASDEVFAAGMARLADGLQNWVIVHFRRARLDLHDPACLARLVRLVPLQDIRHTAKLPLLQSAVSRILVERVFDAYFVGLTPDQAALLAQTEQMLQLLAGAAEPVNHWRALTVALLSRSAAQPLQTETARVVDDVVADVCTVLDGVIAPELSTQPAPAPDARDSALRALVASAVELARLFAAQKAAFHVFMPAVDQRQRLLFDASTMEDMGGEDDDGLAQRAIACAIFPGIIKRGDEFGNHVQLYRNVICKARVLCMPE